MTAPDHTPDAATAATDAQERYVPDTKRAGMALCLSGGGYRAALFHVGVVRRLDELGVLARVDTVSAVSGGSILAGFLANRIPDWPRAGSVAGFDAIIAAFRDFTRKNIRTLWFGRRLLPWKLADSTVAVESLVSRYEKDIVQLRMKDLPVRPRFVFCATDLTFGTNWVAERTRVGSFMTGYVEPAPDWAVARAVAASSCFPPIFEPMPVDLEPERFKGGRIPAGAPGRDELLRDLRLTDGGVYDNMALEPVWKDHAVLLVSDGGGTFDQRSQTSMLRPMKHLGRYLEVQGRQASALRKRWLVAGFLRKEMRGVYLGIGSCVTTFDPAARGYGKDLVDEVISEVRTDLDCFSDAEAAVLENHGYLLADAALRVYGDDAWRDAGPWPKLQIPHPEWMDAAKVRKAMRRSDKRVAVVGRWRGVVQANEGIRSAGGRVGHLLGRLRRRG
jgi:NTE family protein